MERVAANVADLSETRIAESSGTGDDIRHRREERHRPGNWIEGAQSRVERTGSAIGAADTHVFLTAAFREAGGPGKSAAPVRGVAQLPSPDHVIDCSPVVAH